MPVVEYRLVRDGYSDEQIAALLLSSCELFAAELACPVDRVRAYAHMVEPSHACLGGHAATEVEDAPFFSFYLLEGRSMEQRQSLLAGFTDLLVAHLGVDRARIRGTVEMVDPSHWAIAGKPASVVRQAEIAARGPH